MALQLLDVEQLRALIAVARRVGCMHLLLLTLLELVDTNDGQFAAAAHAIAEAAGGLDAAVALQQQQQDLPHQVYVQQRCSRSGRCYRVIEAKGTLLATHESCMHHLPLPEPADFPIKRFKLMQRFPENPSRLEVRLMHALSCTDTAALLHLLHSHPRAAAAAAAAAAADADAGVATHAATAAAAASSSDGATVAVFLLLLHRVLLLLVSLLLPLLLLLLLLLLLQVLVQPSSGVLRACEFRYLEWLDTAAPASLADILRVHDVNYVFRLKQKYAYIFIYIPIYIYIYICIHVYI